jgi:fimbrial isopeptide formation D2 family protein
MRDLLSSTKALRIAATYLMVAVFFAGTPISAFAAMGADIKANGSDGPVTITDGDDFSYSWSSTDATACTLTSPSGDSGISLAGNGGPIPAGHPWYPAVGSSTTLTINCTDGTTTSSDSVVINVVALPSTTPTADITANGSDGPVTITNGSTFSYAWTSTNATACTLTAPNGDSGISLAGNGGPIGTGHPWYPAVGVPTTLTLNCTDGTNTATDSVVINVTTPPSPTVVTADIKAENSDGPVTITDGASWNYSWTSGNATACTLTAPNGDSGISLAGNGGPIVPSHPWYPTVGHPTTLTLNCTDGTSTATDSVVVNVAPVGGAVTADIKANGSDGPVTINNGTDYNYSWTSTGATACTLTAPNGVSGISTAGNGGPISPSHPWYPSIGAPVTLTLDCTDGTNTASDSVVIGVSVSPVVVTADIKANGSDGPVTVVNGDSWNYSWTSTNATACTLTSPTGDSGISINGNGGPIPPGHPWYPAVGGSTTLTLNCTNGGSTATDAVVINVVAGPGGPGPSCPVVTVTSSGSASVTVGNAFTYTITATTTPSVATTTTFSLSGTLPAGLSFSTSTATISGTPTQVGTFPVSITARIDCGSDTDTLTITVESSGGGGGGGGGHHHHGGSPTSEPAPSLEGFCPYLTSYLRYGVANDQMQVIKLQAFLKVFEHFDYVTVNGVFDEATLQAVSEFQVRYKNEILTPWGISQPTGYVYTLTLAKINQILCGTPLPAVHAPVYHAPITKEGCPKEGCSTKEGGRGVPNAVPTVGQNVSQGQKSDNTEGFWSRTATALFSWPHGPVKTLQTLYELLLILVVLYILGSILESVLYKDVPENVSKRFYTKWLTILVGLLLSFWGAYMLKEWPLLLPLLVIFLAVLIWILVRHPRVAALWTKKDVTKTTTEIKSASPAQTTTLTTVATEEVKN